MSHGNLSMTVLILIYRKHPAQINSNADYAVNIFFLAITPAQAESQLHSLERAEGAIGLHVNTDKTEYN